MKKIFQLHFIALPSSYSILLCLLFLAHSTQADSTLRIASAANFIPTLKQIAERFEAEQAIKISIISGSSGKLFTQIQHGLPVDIFLSADKEKPMLLQQRGYALDNLSYYYAQGALVFWHSQTANKQINSEQLATVVKLCQRLAIANPKLAPYGIAANQVILKLSESSNQLEYTLIRGENINQTLQFIISNNVDCAFIALSQATQLNLFSRTDTVLKIPSAWHQAIQQYAIILKTSQQSAAAKSFMQFLQSDEIQALIEQQGYIALH